jgi:hypothetical protein
VRFPLPVFLNGLYRIPDQIRRDAPFAI